MAASDVLVIGAGHNGLTAACYLARAGLDVTVLEANGAIGGMTSSCTPFAEAPEHVVNTCAVDMLYLGASPILAELDLAGVGYRAREVDTPYGYIHSDGASVVLHRSVERTATEFARFSPADARSYVEFIRVLNAALDIALPLMNETITHPSRSSVARVTAATARHLRRLGSIGRLLAEPGMTAVLERFKSPVIQGLLAGLAGFVNPLDEDGGGANHFLVAGAHRFGVYRPVGGTGALPAALERRLVASGGKVVTGARVAEFIVQDGRAHGAVTTDGVEYFARRAVMAACDPRRALVDLLPAGSMERRSQIRAEAIPAGGTGVGPFKVDVALRGRLRLRKPHPEVDLRLPTLVQGTVEEIRDGYGLARNGQVAERIPLISAIPTAVDSTQSPDGQDVLYIYSGAVPINPVGGWDALRDKVTASLMRQVSEIYDGVESMEITRRNLTPDDYAKYATNGSILHVDTPISRAMGPIRPAPGMAGYRAPIPGLWLTGIGTHPGGGVSGFPGRQRRPRTHTGAS